MNRATEADIRELDAHLLAGDAELDPKQAECWYADACRLAHGFAMPQRESFDAAVARARHEDGASRWRAAACVGLNELREGRMMERL